jgi:hypothetical protein
MIIRSANAAAVESPTLAEVAPSKRRVRDAGGRSTVSDQMVRAKSGGGGGEGGRSRNPDRIR